VAKKTQTRDIPVRLVKKRKPRGRFADLMNLTDHKFGKISRIHGDPRASTVCFVRLSG